MRARTVLAAVAFAGTVLLGGAGQVLADDNDDMGSAGADFGSVSQPTSDFGQPASGVVGQGGSEFGPGASGLGQGGSVFDRNFVR
ncbi:hypothetical protein [Streptomyces sp. NPDC020362]|uniref:hypothetical protein n=1 Tax=unclassified Streptomyces TaxID=2593676 RepID=UPI0033FAA7F3